MNKLAFDLVLDKKKSKFDIAISEKFFYVGLGGVLFLLAVFWIFKNNLGIDLEEIKIVKYIGYGFLICILIGTFYGFFDYNGNNRIVKGFITFDENEITINHAEKYKLVELKGLKFKVYDYKDRPINLISDGDPNRSYGGENFVEFNHQNKRHRYQFVADSKKHKDKLLEDLIPIMRNKTEIKY
ncbi:hypothetical protein [Croceitalea vernalis]|uniref:Phosphoribosylaminoimidazolesuccinocarboxamide synthase n=1 Tax=Croceitalea vernalis TaxID=3075599 RepID=A0ABU3BIM1_9FLAO|nr:hypothetical protein [Croceitalea sp. P007]MDT0622021.1 hypothetical protein [Croceitalea sp. P007]